MKPQFIYLHSTIFMPSQKLDKFCRNMEFKD